MDWETFADGYAKAGGERCEPPSLDELAASVGNALLADAERIARISLSRGALAGAEAAEDADGNALSKALAETRDRVKTHFGFDCRIQFAGERGDVFAFVLAAPPDGEPSDAWRRVEGEAAEVEAEAENARAGRLAAARKAAAEAEAKAEAKGGERDGRWRRVSGTSRAVAGALGNLHELWSRLPPPVDNHPLQPALKWWFAEGRPRRPARGIMGMMPDRLREATLPATAQLPIPGMEAVNELMPELALIEPPAMRGSLAGNYRAMPLANRVFFNALMDVKVGDRPLAGGVIVTAPTLGEMMADAFGRIAVPGTKEYRPHERDALLAQLIAALHQLHGFRVPIRDHMQRNVITVRDMPTEATPDDARVLLETRFFGDARASVRVLKEEFQALTRTNERAARAYLRLQYATDRAAQKNGRKRDYDTRPRALRNAEGMLVGADGAVLLDAKKRPIRSHGDPRAVMLDGDGKQATSVKDAAREPNPDPKTVITMTRRDLVRMQAKPGERAADERSAESRQAVRRATRILRQDLSDVVAVTEEIVEKTRGGEQVVAVKVVEKWRARAASEED